MSAFPKDYSELSSSFYFQSRHETALPSAGLFRAEIKVVVPVGTTTLISAAK